MQPPFRLQQKRREDEGRRDKESFRGRKLGLFERGESVVCGWGENLSIEVKSRQKSVMCSVQHQNGPDWLVGVALRAIHQRLFGAVQRQSELICDIQSASDMPRDGGTFATLGLSALSFLLSLEHRTSLPYLVNSELVRAIHPRLFVAHQICPEMVALFNPQPFCSQCPAWLGAP